MRGVCMALALVVAVPLGAGAEPITVNLQSASNADLTGSPTTGWFALDLGELVLSGSDSTATFFISGLKHGSDYTVGLNVSNASGLDNLRFEVLDPLDGDDAWDPASQPAYVPAGYSTSNKTTASASRRIRASRAAPHSRAAACSPSRMREPTVGTS